MQGLIQSIVLGIARNAIMAFGAYILSKGYVDGSTATNVEGSLICLAGVAFTVGDKFFVDKKIQAVAAAPAMTPGQTVSTPGGPVTMRPIPNP